MRLDAYLRKVMQCWSLKEAILDGDLILYNSIISDNKREKI